MTAEQMFRDYKIMKKELSILEFQMGQFKGITEDDIILCMQFSHPEGDDRVQTSTLSDKTAKVAMNYKDIMERENDEWFDYLWHRYHFIKDEVGFFENSVKGLSDVLSEIIMNLIEGELTWENIAAKNHVSTAMIAKYKKKALKELDEVYELRDIQTEAFILG